MKKQQQGFEFVQSQEPLLQRDYQKVQYVDAWKQGPKQKQQQVQTIQRQFQKITPLQPGMPPVYVDKETNKICLFHGTTTDAFRSFTEQQKDILPKFYLSFDLKEAISYANNRYTHKKKQAKDIRPGLLVFKLKDEKILNKLEYSTTHIVLKTPKDIKLFLKNTIVEMITIKPSSPKKQEQTKQQSKSSIGSLGKLFSRWR